MLQEDASLHCRKADWATFSPETLRGDRVGLIVAVVAPRTDAVRAELQRLRAGSYGAPVLAVLGDASPEHALAAAVDLTDDFILAPPAGPQELRHRVRRLLGSGGPAELDAARVSLSAELGVSFLVGSSAKFAAVVRDLPRMAASDLPVLITGETGTGKELVARALHHLGPRRDLPFVAVDCGAVPDHLFENELFGHDRGAYTDAHRDQKGLISMASGGTLFLDEIDALSLVAQAKLLRFLQERTFRPLGSDRFVKADVNVISASNRSLEAHVDANRFRSDLYFRLNVLRVSLPALRERGGDVGPLAQHFLATERATGAPSPRLSPAARALLDQYDWPGNVRELYNVIQRAAVLCDGPLILPSHLSLPHLPANLEGDDFVVRRTAAVNAFERRYVEELLRKHRGNVTHAARAAGKERRVFGRLMKKHSIDRRAFAH